jgi:hypothetical protein
VISKNFATPAYAGPSRRPTTWLFVVSGHNRSAGILAQRRISASVWFYGQKPAVGGILDARERRVSPRFRFSRAPFFSSSGGRAIHVFCLNLSERDHD